MLDAITEAIVKEAHFVTLEVRRANLAARALYRKLKFEERRLRKNYYGPGEDAIVMDFARSVPAVVKLAFYHHCMTRDGVTNLSMLCHNKLKVRADRKRGH